MEEGEEKAHGAFKDTGNSHLSPGRVGRPPGHPPRSTLVSGRCGIRRLRQPEGWGPRTRPTPATEPEKLLTGRADTRVHARVCVSASRPQACVPQADRIGVPHTPCSPRASLQEEHRTLRKSDSQEPDGRWRGGPASGESPASRARRGASAHGLSPRPPGSCGRRGRWRGPARTTVPTLAGGTLAGTAEA